MKFGWGLFKEALEAEPDNFNYRAALARIGGALEAKGYALPEGMPQPAVALLDAASRIDAAVKAGSLSGFEAVESLCNLVIAAFGLDDFETSLTIAEQGLLLDPAHHSVSPPANPPVACDSWLNFDGLLAIPDAQPCQLSGALLRAEVARAEIHRDADGARCDFVTIFWPLFRACPDFLPRRTTREIRRRRST